MGGPSERPLVDTIEGSRHSNMKELRAGSVRILFAFDPTRRAVLLVAGDKAGLRSRWYEAAVPLADRRFDEWLADGPLRLDVFRAIEAEIAASPRSAAPNPVQAEQADQQRTQAQVAELMGVGQRRVSDIESAQLARTGVATIDSYVSALGGRLRLVAEFGDQAIQLR